MISIWRKRRIDAGEAHQTLLAVPDPKPRAPRYVTMAARCGDLLLAHGFNPNEVAWCELNAPHWPGVATLTVGRYTYDKDGHIRFDRGPSGVYAVMQVETVPLSSTPNWWQPEGVVDEVDEGTETP